MRYGVEQRKHKRYKKRCEIEFSLNGSNYRGISSNLSLNGLFIKTKNPLKSGTMINLIVHLPDGSTSQLKGIVRRAVRNPIDNQKNGMGIEIIEKDSHYLDFIDSLSLMGEYCLDKIDLLF